MLKKIVFIPLFLMIFMSSPISSGIKKLPIEIYKGKSYISLFSIIKYLPLSHDYDPILQRGVLYHKTMVAVFQLNNSTMLINRRIWRTKYPVIKRSGEILLPYDFSMELFKKFFVQWKFVKKNKTVVIHFKDEKDIITYNPVKKTGKYQISFIIIDAGHGGKDPGAMGKGRLKEKDITLKIAKYTGYYFKRRNRSIPVYYTRNSDRFIALSKRSSIANRFLNNKNNGIFVSIHVNASLSPRISGFETYFLSQNPSNDSARSTAALENNVIVLEENRGRNRYSDIDYIEAHMLMAQIQKESSMLSRSIQNGMRGNNGYFKSRGIKKADFYVLRGSLMPAALVEVGYITNRKEARYLRKSWYQRRIAAGIAQGINSFIHKYNRMIKK